MITARNTEYDYVCIERENILLSSAHAERMREFKM